MLYKIPDDLSSIISIYLELQDIKHVACTSSNEITIYKSYYLNRFRIEMFRKRYSYEIISLMNGIDNMLQYPTLPWQRTYLGSTGYIDGIPFKDLSAPIMKGIDGFNRAFITLRIVMNKKNSKITNSGNPEQKHVQTLFQRYSNNISTWAHVCNGWGIIRESGHFMINGVLHHTLLKQNIQFLQENKGYVYDYKYIQDGKELYKISATLV